MAWAGDPTELMCRLWNVPREMGNREFVWVVLLLLFGKRAWVNPEPVSSPITQGGGACEGLGCLLAPTDPPRPPTRSAHLQRLWVGAGGSAARRAVAAGI